MAELKSSTVIKRYPGNPVLSGKDVPYPATLTYNAGITKYQGKYVMVFRNDVYDKWEGKLKYIDLGLAYSNDGKKWDVQPKPILNREFFNDKEIKRAYDPRLTVIDGKVVLCFAVDTFHGLRGGIAVTEDFEKFEVKSMTVPDNRNMVVFPEKVGGMYLRLERPFPVYSRG
ncbi:MAG: glycosidase, partial [Elusimicrobiota bacterium]